MEEVPGGVSRIKSCNAYATYRGRAGEIADAMKKKGVMDGGANLGPHATNVIPGTKRTNKMLSPGPGHRKHS